MNLKGYTLRKNGSYHRDRRVKVILPASAVETIMQRTGVSQAKAEATLVSSALECLGLAVDESGKVGLNDGKGLTAIEMPLVIV